jgi:hypothetical protein
LTASVDASQAYVGATGQHITGVNVSNVVYTTDPGTDNTTEVAFDLEQTLAPAHDLLTVSVTAGTTTKEMTNQASGGCVVSADFRTAIRRNMSGG